MWPDKAQYRPGDAIVLHVPPAATTALVSELGKELAILPVVDGVAHWVAPAAPEHAARGLWAVGLDAAGEVVGSTAFDVAQHWSVAPRYGFLCNFKPGETAAAPVAGLNRLHINAVQFYDWMFTHYQFFADSEEFTDPLGRQSSHAVVRAKIEECHRHGIACLAYGAVYGGEQPIADAHPEWLLHDGNHVPYKFGWWGSHLQNFDHGCGWREHLLQEFEGAITRLDFDGIHVDSYGYPKRGIYLPEPERVEIVDLTRALPEFVAETALRVRQLKPAGGTSFNCVNTWPVELMARRTEDQVTYMELWSPHDTYRDLYDQIRLARVAGPHKQVVIAAYLSAFHKETPRLPQAIHGLQLAASAIFASGGFYLLLGEGNGVLAKDYFPDFGRVDGPELETVVRYWDFVTAYGELLHDRELRDVSKTWNGVYVPETQYDGPVACSPVAEPGTIWTILKEKPGRRVLHLINLVGQENARWNELKAEPLPIDGLTVTFMKYAPIRAAWYASPDDGGQPQPLTIEPDTTGRPFVHLRLPRLHVWGMVWLEE